MTEEIKEAICQHLANGLSLVDVCKLDGFPVRSHVYYEQLRDESFRARIARAREIGQDCIIDQCRDIADSATPENWQVARLRIWHRQWEAAKRAPKAFGDRIGVEHGVTVELAEVIARARKRQMTLAGELPGDSE